MYNVAPGTFQCAPEVFVTLHPSHNPFITQLLKEASNITIISVNLSLSHNRSPLPNGPFQVPSFLDYILASGAYTLLNVVPHHP